MSPCPRAIDTGAYVLGALEPQEREAFAEHLRTCDQCRREVEELRVAAEALPLTAEPVDPPPELRDRIMELVRAEARAPDDAGRRERRGRAAGRARRRRLGGAGRVPLAVAACALLALGVAVGLLVGGGGEPSERAVQAKVAVAGASGTLHVSDNGDAQLVVRGLPAPPPGRVYQVWRKQPGAKVPQPTDALFSVSRDGTATVDVPGGIKGVDQVLVSDEPRRGSRVPTGDVVLTASPA
jgi:anti-sigma-K factor RskA